jgi:hypothetical protein
MKPLPPPPGTSYLTDLDDAWKTRGHGPRLRARFAAGPRVVSVRTLPLRNVPYPTRYAFNSAAISLAPFVTIAHRCVLVQFMQNGALKNLLFNPTDVEAAKATPFFARLGKRIPPRLEAIIAKKFEALEHQLGRLGLMPEDIDYVAFDHFHTQDLRPLLGTEGGPHAPRFPNAVLLAPKAEWDDWDDLHPMQRAWFVAEGKRDVLRDKVALTEGDLALGDGVMLVRTPGHTSGNQTLFFHTHQGVWGISECGTCADSWSPLESKIMGLASYCRVHDVDVVINSNTPEFGADQYTSMVLERTIVDRVKRAPGFVQMFPSSEVTPTMLAPGIKPTLLHRAVTSGEIARRATSRARPPAEEAKGSARGVDARARSTTP